MIDHLDKAFELLSQSEKGATAGKLAKILNPDIENPLLFDAVKALEKLIEDGYATREHGLDLILYHLTFDGKLLFEEAKNLKTSPYKLLASRKAANHNWNKAKTSMVVVNAVAIIGISLINIIYQSRDIAVQREMLEVQKAALVIQKSTASAPPPIVNVIIDTTRRR